jgi:branched-chain amino acid aminotransferase
VWQVSVYDSGFILGDGMWEGLRLHRGVLNFVEAHVDRLFENLKAVDMPLGLTKPELIRMVRNTPPFAFCCISQCGGW